MITNSSNGRLRGHGLGIAPAAPASNSAVWVPQWVGCHGGAGVTTLIKLTGIGHDAGRAWPAKANTTSVPVLLVCRASGPGTNAATAFIEQAGKRSLRHVPVLGLVAVAASPKPVPATVSARLKLMAAWLPRHWWIGWQEDYVAADDPCAVGTSPQVRALQAELRELVAGRHE